MKPKIARRFFERNYHKLARERLMAQIGFFGYSKRKQYKPYLQTLRTDQQNPASRRVYQRALNLLK